ncbi:hypothetical protein SARC_02901 [Sphaeroforma arctica JP610]|uniref:Uncharacterized protein n=1 Tax=Sphaeroforma arctica JP610 TaxID=667725 RepID=A0A0L0G9F5_9EUKA|nr:hypothetical protein SARC_02901 [Sphaeroforma arctica JP610]KNC84893.1 hypothetical protein SARC_02901 [Sphaeroforma arctica JP610]|eukprot:XP_014158795.1 hypothetical protein SARC_02901 [Sphaeroforma arctica JP610]
MNMFTFFNVPVEEAAGANAIASMPSSENIGTITTTFTGFIKGGLRSRSAFRGIRNNVHEKPKITEKEKIKKGASIGVCGGKEVTRRSRSTTYHFPEKLKQEMPQKSIKIYIREKFWLQSRRIMDGDGLPMTAAVAKKGVGATQSKSGVNNNPMIDVDAMNAQFKIKREAIGSQKRKMRAINLDEPTGLETCKKKPKGEVIVLG